MIFEKELLVKKLGKRELIKEQWKIQENQKEFLEEVEE